MTWMNGILNNTRNTKCHPLFSKDQICNRQCYIVNSINSIEWFPYDGDNHPSAFIAYFEQVPHINVVSHVQRHNICVSVSGCKKCYFFGKFCTGTKLFHEADPYHIETNGLVFI